MSRRNRVIGKIAGDEPHKLSDKAARLWESYQRPMQGAAQALNAAIQNTENVLGGIIMQMEGFSPDTHLLDVGRMVIVRRPTEPQPSGENGK